MKYGMTGKILRVDLSNQSHSVETPDEKIYRTYFGRQESIRLIPKICLYLPPVHWWAVEFPVRTDSRLHRFPL
jgi:hypothetical protein